MDKAILKDYIDACELIRETEKDIERLEKKQNTVLQTSVRGSNPEFPYEEKRFTIYGTEFSLEESDRLEAQRQILMERKAKAERIKTDVEEWMNTIPVRMQRIVRYRIFERMSWEKVAEKLGRQITGDGVRMEYQRFFKKR